jgi:hypothetical protein
MLQRVDIEAQRVKRLFVSGFNFDAYLLTRLLD